MVAERDINACGVGSKTTIAHGGKNIVLTKV